MSNTVLIKRSAAPNAVPTSGQLVHGELAINYLDGNLFYKDASNLVVVIASNQFVSVTGNVTGGNLITVGNAVVGGIKTDNYMYANGQPFDTSLPAGANTQIQFNNGAGDFGASANLTFDSATNLLNVVGNISTNSVTSTFTLGLNSSGNGNIILNADGTGITKTTGTWGFVVPVGNTAQRPDYPNYIAVDAGTTRFNTTVNAMEVWTGSAWQIVGSQAGNVSVGDQQITPDGSSSSYALNQASTAAGILVTLNGVAQIPNVAYTVTGNTLTFLETPLSSDIVDIRFLTSATAPSVLYNSTANSAVQVTDTPQINFIVNNTTRAAITAAGIMDLSTGHSLQLPVYSVATANVLGNVSNGELIYVSDGDSGNPCLAVYSAGAWRRVALGATISI